MTTDLQIIDAFERLREEFQRDNPGAVPTAPPPAGEGVPSVDRIMTAWLLARRPGLGGSPAGQRRLRVLLRGKPDAKAVPPLSDAEREMADWVGKLRDKMTAAAHLGKVPSLSAAVRAPAEEAIQWNLLLPGLVGLKIWKFLEELDRPFIAPQAPIRRLLWRLGLVDDASARDTSVLQCVSALQRIAGLTGLPVAQLRSLVSWTSKAQSGFAGGGWCIAEPRCADCPLLPVCAWARFHPPAEAPPPTAAVDPAQSAHQRVVQGRQDQLEEVELLALVLPSRIGGRSRQAAAEDLLRRFDGLRGLDRASVAELAAIPGFSERRAAQLKAALELGRRLADRAFRPGDPIRSSEDVWRAYRARFRSLPQEHFVIVLLDTKNRVIHDHIVSKGTLNGSHAHPREVFHEAVRQSAASVILLHNHPSGDPTPSPEDRSITQRLREAGEILGIHVLDHIVLGADDYYSFKDES